jgi:hypothetical protein
MVRFASAFAASAHGGLLWIVGALQTAMPGSPWQRRLLARRARGAQAA